MNPDVQQYLLIYQATEQYLKLSARYCEYLGGLRWSYQEDALVYPDGRYVAFNEAIAEFLEGFQAGGRFIAFSYILHWMDLLQNLRGLELPEVQRLKRSFHATGGRWRNAGALAAVLSAGIPEVPQPPQMEMICRRLRDRAFPIRWYAARFHDSPEVPPLPADVFQDTALDQVAAYSDAELETWFATGRGSVRRAGKALTEERPHPRSVTGVLTALLQRPRLARAETFVRQLVAALALPPRRLTPQELPLGGYADLVTHGHVEHLLPSQHALEDLDFLRRFAEHELLFFRREEPPAPQRQELAVLLDQGVRTWGDVRLVLSAAALALARQAHARKVPFTLAATSNGGRGVELLTEDFEALAQLVEASDFSSDPGLALETLLEEPGALPRDIVILTHPRCLQEPDVCHAARRLGTRDRLFAVALDGSGQVVVSEIRHGAPIRLRQFHVDFTPSRVAAPERSATGDASTSRAWTGDVEPVPSPFRIYTDGVLHAYEFDHDGQHLLTASGPAPLLHVWKLDGSGVECLPRPYRDGRLLTGIASAIGVQGGFALFGRDTIPWLAHYDLGRRRCRVFIPPDTSALNPPRLFYSESHMVLLGPPSRPFACDLATGKCLSRDQESDDDRLADAYRRLGSGQCSESGRRISDRSDGSGRSSVYVDTAIGLVHFTGSTQRTFEPQADGKPILKGVTSSHDSQLAGTVLAIRYLVKGSWRLLLLRHEDGSVITDYPLNRKNRRFVSFLLSPDGRRLALRRSDHRVHVELVEGNAPPFVTRQGGFSETAQLYVGGDYLMLALGAGHQFWHVLDWASSVLEHTYERRTGVRVDRPESFFSPAIQACLRRATPVLAQTGQGAVVLDYDRARFTAAAWSGAVETSDMLFALDRFGQVAILDADDRLVAMVMALGDRIGAWLPDGTRFGTLLPSQGPSTVDARVKIARALQAAARKETPS